ncbi:lytic transglycosylase domain-containing protein [Plesiomonas sp. ZOR0011]|uniref:lytic transglycosylase domain-containing protein n=1 Tax=Plesiomonas sp. ZOR0011 TaxID=1339230 RepID=UPI00068F7A28|nr:lytic transglycosylase domain-containing protein [Plesiomonas sp. ZOR0011]
MDGFLPPQPPSIEACIAASSNRFNVHTDLIKAVIRTEGGKVGTKSKNKNGSYDLGIMQINTIHLPSLQQYGITEKQLIHNACVNIAAGTWLLAKSIGTPSNAYEYWQGVGNYHSKTPKLNVTYRNKVWRNLLSIRQKHSQRISLTLIKE